jgi:GNAT superfamily N-acetyltransferase
MTGTNETERKASSAVSPSAGQHFRIYPAESAAQIEQIRELFLEYAKSLGFSLCFQRFDQELAGLPGDYAPPDGRLLLAEYAGQIAGCGALHRVPSYESRVRSREPEMLPAANTKQSYKSVVSPASGDSAEKRIGEMKRLYLRPAFRGKGLGRLLAERILQEARSIGYAKLRLDTVEPVMKDAVAMYRRMGFREIEAYRLNPMAGTLYMELDLAEGLGQT